MSTCITPKDIDLYGKIIPWHDHGFVAYRPYNTDHVETAIFFDNVDFSREWPHGSKIWDHTVIMHLVTAYLRKNDLIGLTDSVLTSIPESGTGAIKICIKWKIRPKFTRADEFLKIYYLHFTMEAMTAMITSGLFDPVEQMSTIIGYRFQPYLITNLVEELEIDGKIKVDPARVRE